MSTDPLPEQAEVIGPLVFVPNPDYPYPFPVPRPPRFWMEETTGRLAAAVEHYMQGEPLTADELEVIKIYLTQYLERAVIEGSADRKRLLSRIPRLRTTRDIERFADELSEVGVEPF
ncbi:MAG: hypothetical protein C0184_02530 [Chloroflexus aggregans]|uniref:Uncharacterized protein n=1 Tax=Chloroflexus aggregans TaxID=152260 RepID=A0A2J6XC57_9CHLR|nr:MAG: hypothetical protein C0184_02530 [Chloroflexus aggregans]